MMLEADWWMNPTIQQSCRTADATSLTGIFFVMAGARTFFLQQHIEKAH